MAYNDRRIVSILLEECCAVDERFPGYRDEMKKLVAEVLSLEREHAIARINISQKIANQVNTLGVDLHRSQNSIIESGQ